MRWTESKQLEIEVIEARIPDVDPIVLQIVEGTSNVQKLIIAGIACGHTQNR